MVSGSARRRYQRHKPARQVVVLSALNHALTPDDLARVLATAALEQVRRDQAAARGFRLSSSTPSRDDDSNGEASDG